MTRLLFLFGPLLLAACATPVLPSNSDDEQTWFDARVEEGASADNAPNAVPDKTPAISADVLRQSAEDVLQARDAVAAEERAARSPVTDTEAYAESARQRAVPPPPID